MYHTEMNMRTWEEPLASLLRIGVGALFNSVAGDLQEIDEHDRTGLEAFDRLSQGQQLYLLNTVARALLIERASAPELNQLVETTLMAIFNEIAVIVEMNADDPESFEESNILALLRQVYLAECRQIWGSREECERMPTISEASFRDWKHLVDEVSQGFFYDLDMEDESIYAALPLARRRELLGSMMIKHDYFDWIPREPSELDFHAMRREIIELISPVLKLIWFAVEVPEWSKETHRFEGKSAESGEMVQIMLHTEALQEGRRFTCRTADGQLIWREAKGRYRNAFTEELLLTKDDPEVEDESEY